MAEPVSPPARRLRQPSWFDLRLAVGVLLVLVSVLVGAKVVSAADRSVRVWAVTSDLAAGTTLAPDDVRPVRVRLFDNADHYLAVAGSPAGRTLLRDIGRDELLPRQALVARAPGQLVSLPVSALHAPGSLRRGQRIDVFATTKVGQGPSRTDRVLAAVPVQAVRLPRGGLAGEGTDLAVLVSVPPGRVTAVVQAVRTAEIDVTVVVGGPGTTDASAAATGPGTHSPTPPATASPRTTASAAGTASPRATASAAASPTRR